MSKTEIMEIPVTRLQSYDRTCEKNATNWRKSHYLHMRIEYFKVPSLIRNGEIIAISINHCPEYSPDLKANIVTT